MPDDGPISDSMEGDEQIGAAKSLHSDGTSLMEGPDRTEGTNTSVTYFTVLEQYVDMDYLKRSAFPWEWDEVRNHLLR
jgi:hypothetical protein